MMDFARRVARYEIWLVTAVSPFLLFPNRWSGFFLGPVVILWLLRWISLGRPSRPSPLNAPIIYLVLLSVAGYIVAPDRSLSLPRLWGMFLGAALFFAVLNWPRRPADLLWMARFLVLATIALAVVSVLATDWRLVRLVELSFYEKIPSLLEGRSALGFIPTSERLHPRVMGATLAMVLPVSMAFSIYSRNNRDRFLGLVGLVAGGSLVLLSQAIMAYFGLFLAIYLLLLWRVPRLIWLIPLGLLAAGATFLLAGPERILLMTLDQDSAMGIGAVLRLDMWSRAWAIFRDMPFTGAGLDMYRTVQTQFYPGYLLGPEEHAHNLLLQLLVDYGLPGLLAFLWLLAALACTWRASYREAIGEGQTVLVGLGAGIVAYLAGGALDVLALGNKPTVGLWVMIGLVGASQRMTADSSRTARPYHLAARYAGLLTLIGVLILLIPHAARRNLSLLAAHRAIYGMRVEQKFSSENTEKATDALEESATEEPENPQLQGTLASLYAWGGRPAQAVAAIDKRLELDLMDPLGRYAPFIAWRRKLAGEPMGSDSDNLRQIYSHWHNRYPARAEGWLMRAALELEATGNSTEAADWLARGRQVEAQPANILVQERVEQIGE